MLKLLIIGLKVLGMLLVCVYACTLLTILHYTDKNDKNIEKEGGWFCSGFFISQNGYIATARHCMPNKDGQLYVFTSEGLKYKASVVGISKDHDIAIIKINKDNNSYFSLLQTVRIGDYVIGMGFPNPQVNGFNLKTYRGVIAGETEGLEMVEMFVDGGSSGEAVVNTFGAVEGILVEAEVTDGVSGSMHGYATPVSDLIQLAYQYNVPMTLSLLPGFIPTDTGTEFYMMDKYSKNIVFIEGIGEGLDE